MIPVVERALEARLPDSMPHGSLNRAMEQISNQTKEKGLPVVRIDVVARIVEVPKGQTIMRPSPSFSLLLHFANHVGENIPAEEIDRVIVEAGSSAPVFRKQRVTGTIKHLRNILDDRAQKNIIRFSREGNFYSFHAQVAFVEQRKHQSERGNGSVSAFSRKGDIFNPEDLARRAAQRDGDTFSQLYEEHLNTVYRYVLYKVGDGGLAEELTAEVFSKAWEGIDHFQWRNLPFQHWLLRIARNAVVDHWRVKRKQTSDIEDFRDVPSDELEPDERVVRRFENEELRRGLAQLPDDQRDVLILEFIDGYSHVEAADILGKSVVAVRQIKVRALGALRKILANPESNRKKVPQGGKTKEVLAQNRVDSLKRWEEDSKEKESFTLDDVAGYLGFTSPSVALKFIAPREKDGRLQLTPFQKHGKQKRPFTREDVDQIVRAYANGSSA